MKVEQKNSWNITKLKVCDIISSFTLFKTHDKFCSLQNNLVSELEWEEISPKLYTKFKFIRKLSFSFTRISRRYRTSMKYFWSFWTLRVPLQLNSLRFKELLRTHYMIKQLKRFFFVYFVLELHWYDIFFSKSNVFKINIIGFCIRRLQLFTGQSLETTTTVF